MIVRESIHFERGKDPKQAMSIGFAAKIKDWMDDYEIKKYRINEDYTIDTFGHVDLNCMGLYKLPDYIKFNRAHDEFWINWNNLHNLIGCPKICDSNFFINGNPLKSLEGLPQKIGQSLTISKVCGFSEKEIRKICEVRDLDVFEQGDDDWEKVSRIKKRYIGSR